MIEDRDYMRQPEYDDGGWRPGLRFRWSWMMTLIAAYTAVWLAELTVSRFFPQSGGYFSYLALSRAGIEHGYVWQLLTYQFLHAGWLHLLLNCWAIYMFGGELERMLGARRALTVTFASGIVGGVFQVLTAMVWPSLFDTEVVGASACAFGLVAAYAMINPERELTMLVFFIIPVRMRAKTLLIFSAVVAIVLIIFPITNIANAAHLGGMAMGWFYVRKILNRDWAMRFFKRSSPRPEPSPERPPEISSADFVTDEVDPILDKISAKGIQSLTTREREILEKARARMVKH